MTPWIDSSLSLRSSVYFLSSFRGITNFAVLIYVVVVFLYGGGASFKDGFGATLEGEPMDRFVAYDP